MAPAARRWGAGEVGMKGTATYSPCETYRYRMERVG